MPHTEFLTGRDLYERVIGDLLPSARDSLLVATAPLKATRLVRPDGTVESVVRLLARLGRRGVAVRVLHAGVPSGPFLEELRAVEPGLFQMRRCPRTHFKAAVVDGRRLYLGSANLTGAGLGAKSPERRNFEVGLLSDDPALVDAVADLFEAVWSGAMCPTCGRRDHCPVPLEEPWSPLVSVVETSGRRRPTPRAALGWARRHFVGRGGPPLYHRRTRTRPGRRNRPVTR